MKKSLRSLLIGTAVLTAPQIASASIVLAGYHDFGTITTGNYNYSGFIGSVNLPTGSSVQDPGGSNDGIYGSMDPSSDENWVKHENNLTWNNPAPDPPNAAQGTNDGAVVVTSTNSFVFSVTNLSGSDMVLESLLFDMVRQTSNKGTVQLDYSYTNFATTPEALGTIATTRGYIGGGGSQDFDDAVKDLTDLALPLNAGDTISFKFTALLGEMKFDNISLNALTPIPEPGSLLALGCVVGSGAFLRSRRRGVRIA